MQKEMKESGDPLNLASIQLRQKEKTGKEEKEMEEGGDLLNLVLKWKQSDCFKQKQVLEAIGATGAGATGAGATGATSSMQVSIIHPSS